MIWKALLHWSFTPKNSSLSGRRSYAAALLLDHGGWVTALRAYVLIEVAF
jgi:hypothetical protein